MNHWFNTFIDEQYFPFYEFMWVCMLGLWWSVISRLRRIETLIQDVITEIVNEGDY